MNVWSKKEYPWLPHDKFLLYNEAGDKNIEVQIDPDVADDAFKLIQAYKKHPEVPVLIMGRLIGVDLPTMNACHRDLVIQLKSAEGIAFASPN